MFKTKLFAALIVVMLVILLVGCSGKLTLRMLIPVSGATISESPVEVEGIVSNKRAIVWVNDKVIQVSQKGLFSTYVYLDEGENVINIVAAKGKPGKWSDVIGSTVVVFYVVSE